MSRPVIVAIAGLSASGKTTLAQDAAEILDAPLLQMDDYYRDIDHAQQNPPAVETATDPSGFNWDRLEMFDLSLWEHHILMLAQGRSVQAPVYDFNVSRRVGEREVKPARAVVVEGQFVLAHPRSSGIAALRVYLHLDPKDALERRVARDTLFRGRTHESVCRQWQEHVLPAYHHAVLPSQARADLVLHGDQPRLQNLHKLVRAVEQAAARLAFLA